MTASILLLTFLLVLGVGISTILYVSKSSKSFNYLAGWSLFVYLLFALVTLIGITGVLGV